MSALALLLTAVLVVAAAAQAAAHGTAAERLETCRPRQPRPRNSKLECTRLVQEYMSQHAQDFDAPHDVHKLLFFLHVPRTAGKTYANCFLRTALPPSKRCAKSYDTLRLNVSIEGCQTLISHDDYSISQFFPPGAATITQLRRPVDRLISSYEFAVDVAAKGVLHLERPRKNPKRRADFVGTLEVWPWSILVPWFKHDMAARLEKLKQATLQDGTAWRAYTSPDNRTYYWNEAKNSSVWVLPDPDPVLNPYNNSLVMPLHEFIEHPIAEELLHNGGTLQVLGITNYSYWQGAEELRRCVRSSSIAREMLLTLAVKRLKSMAHVGLTERLDESVVSLAADMGISFEGPAYQYTSSSAFSYDGGAAHDDDQLTFASVLEKRNLTVSRREAALRIKAIIEEQRELKLALDELNPRLTALVDQEERWLAEQDAQQAAEGDEGGTVAAAEEDDLASADGQQQGLAGVEEQPEGLAEEQGHVGTEAASSYLEAAAAAGEASCSEGRSDTCSAGQADAGSGEEVGSEEAAYGSGDVAAGSAEAAYDGAEQAANTLYRTEDSGGSAASEGGVVAEGGGAQEQRQGEQQEGDDEDEWFTDLDSPFSEEIKALDAQIAAKQKRMRRLDRELISLQNSGLVVSADEATGRARQLIADEHYLIHNNTLGQAYMRCATAGKGGRDKQKLYKHLQTPWGETFAFQPQSRALIPHEVRARIHQLNALDEELWKAGHQILEKKLAEQRESGILDQLMKALPPRHTPQQAGQAPQQPYTPPSKRRKLQSRGESGKARPAAADPAEPAVRDEGADLYASESQAAAAVPAAAEAAEAATESLSSNDTAAAAVEGHHAAEQAGSADAGMNASSQAHDEL